MDPLDPLILRWLSRVDDQSPFVLGFPPMADADQAQSGEQSLIRRLSLVEGLLGTLDHRPAPRDLDVRFEGILKRLEAEGGEWPSEWLSELAAIDQQFGELDTNQVEKFDLKALIAEENDGLPTGGPQKAPDFLDRIVEQRMQSILNDAESGAQAKAAKRPLLERPWKRVSLGVSALLVAFILPWGNWMGAGEARPSNSIQLTEYNSLEGLRSAHPEQVRIASQFGEFGALAQSAGIVFDGAGEAPNASPKKDEGRAQ